MILFLFNHETDNLFFISLIQRISTFEKNTEINGSEERNKIDNIVQGIDENVKKIQVNVTKLDNWVKDNKKEKLDFIKCDVEGAEYFIYKGGIETIKKFKPVIFSEMLRKWSKKFGYHPNDIIEFLKNVGYNCYVINSNLGLTEIKEVTEETVETNFFFLNQENHKDIINSLCK